MAGPCKKIKGFLDTIRAGKYIEQLIHWTRIASEGLSLGTTAKKRILTAVKNESKGKIVPVFDMKQM
jgi:hypothetical protein